MNFWFHTALECRSGVASFTWSSRKCPLYKMTNGSHDSEARKSGNFRDVNVCVPAKLNNDWWYVSRRVKHPTDHVFVAHNEKTISQSYLIFSLCLSVRLSNSLRYYGGARVFRFGGGCASSMRRPSSRQQPRRPSAADCGRFVEVYSADWRCAFNSLRRWWTT